MPSKFKNYTLKSYLDVLAKKEPVPGGGSAAALTGALGAALLCMVANYSKGKSQSKMVEKRIQRILDQSEAIRKRFLELVDLDAEAYLNVVKTKNASPREKKAALKGAQKVPQEVCRLSYKAVQLAPFLVQKGNKYLIGDVEAAIEMLMAAFNSALHLK